MNRKYKTMEEVIRNYATIDGQVYHAGMVANALKAAGYIHKLEISNVIDKMLIDKNLTHGERVRILLDWIEALQLVEKKCY